MHNVRPCVFSRPWGINFTLEIWPRVYKSCLVRLRGLQILLGCSLEVYKFSICGMAEGLDQKTFSDPPSENIGSLPPPPPYLGCNGKMLLIKYITFEHFLRVWSPFSSPTQFAPIVAFLLFRTVDVMGGYSHTISQLAEGSKINFICHKQKNLLFCLYSMSPFMYICILWTYGVVVSMFDFHRSDRGSNTGRGGEKFHNVYDYTIERHPWQVSENHKPRVHPSHMWEIG